MAPKSKLVEPDRVDKIIAAVRTSVDKVLYSVPVTQLMNVIHSTLSLLGIPSSVHPDVDQVALCCSATFFTLFNYYIWLGNSHVKRRRLLANDLEKAAERVHELEEQLLKLAQEDAKNGGDGGSNAPKKEIRIFMDGAFDMMHYGHMNAFRQGKSLGTTLVVGINSDESITRCKGECGERDA